MADERKDPKREKPQQGIRPVEAKLAGPEEGTRVITKMAKDPKRGKRKSD